RGDRPAPVPIAQIEYLPEDGADPLVEGAEVRTAADGGRVAAALHRSRREERAQRACVEGVAGAHAVERAPAPSRRIGAEAPGDRRRSAIERAGAGGAGRVGWQRPEPLLEGERGGVEQLERGRLTEELD